MPRIQLLALQLLVAVVAVLIWHVCTTVPIGGVKLLPPFFFSTPGDVGSRIVKWFVEGTIWRHLWITLIESVLAFVIGSVAGVLVGFWFARQPLVAVDLRPVCEDGERAAAGGAGADLRALARARHLVEGGARRHAWCSSSCSSTSTRASRR